MSADLTRRHLAASLVAFASGVHSASAEEVGTAYDLRRFGSLSLGRDVNSSQQDANTATMLAALTTALNDPTVRLLDLPAGDIQFGSSPSPRLNGALFPAQGTAMLLRGNQTRIWLPGSSRDDYLGFFTFVGVRGRCGMLGDLVIRQINPAVSQGRVAAHQPGACLDLDLDWRPAWGGRSPAAPGSVACVHRWSERREPQGHLAVRAAGLPMWPIPGGAGRRYRVDISGQAGVPEILNPALTKVGVQVSLQHCKYVGHIVTAYGCELLEIGPGVTIQDGAGMAVYVQGTALRFDGTVSQPVVDGAPRLLSVTSDGVHATGGGRTGFIRGSVSGTGDDCYNAACYTSRILGPASAGALTIGLDNPHWGAPIAGDLIDLVDETGAQRGAFQVTTRTDDPATPPAKATLALGGNLPPGVNANWRVVNRTTAQAYRVDGRAAECLGAGLRSSAVGGALQIRAERTLLEAAYQGSFFDVEYAVADPLIVRATYNEVCCSLDPVRHGVGVVGLRPYRANASHYVAPGTAGNVLVLGIAGRGANAPLLYAEGVGTLVASSLRGEGLTPTFPDDGFRAPAFAQFINCGRVELYNLDNTGRTALAINLRGTQRFLMRGADNVISPRSGAANMDL